MPPRRVQIILLQEKEMNDATTTNSSLKVTPFSLSRILTLVGFFLPWITIEGCGTVSGFDLAKNVSPILYVLPISVGIGLLAGFGVKIGASRWTAVKIGIAAEFASLAYILFSGASEISAKTGGWGSPKKAVGQVLAEILGEIASSPNSSFGLWMVLVGIVLSAWFGGLEELAEKSAMQTAAAAKDPSDTP